MKDYIEETATVSDIEKTKKNKLIYTVAMFVCFIFAVLSFVFSPISVQIVDGEAVMPTGLPLIINICTLIITVGGFLGLSVFFNKKRNKALVEFDYYFTEDKIVISKILNREVRKFCIKIFTGNIYKIGKVDSETYNKIKVSPDVKIGNYLANKTPSTDKNFYYIAVKDSFGHSLLLIESSEDFIKCIVKKTTKSVCEEGFKIDILR